MNMQENGIWVSLRDLLNSEWEPERLASEIEGGRLIFRHPLGLLRKATAS